MSNEGRNCSFDSAQDSGRASEFFVAFYDKAGRNFIDRSGTGNIGPRRRITWDDFFKLPYGLFIRISGYSREWGRSPETTTELSLISAGFFVLTPACGCAGARPWGQAGIAAFVWRI